MTERGTKRARGIIFFLCSYWVAMFCNSRMPERIPTYSLVHLFAFPRAIRFIEVFALTVLYVVLTRSGDRPITRRVNLLMLLFLGVALAGVVIAGALGADPIQDIYIRLVPFLIFVVAARAGVEEKEARRMCWVLMWFYAASVVTAFLLQIPAYEDFITGFYSDAHDFGTFSALFSILAFLEFIWNRRLRWLVVSLAILAFSMLPRNGKAVLLNGCALLAIGFLALWRGASRATRIFLLTALAAISFLGYSSVEEYLVQKTDLRIDQLVSIGIDQFGALQAWPIALDFVTSSVRVSVIGLGAGEYGWIAASRAVLEGRGSEAAQTFEIEFSDENPHNAGFLFRTNTWTSLLAEYGFLGFLLFMAAFGSIVVAVFRTPIGTLFDRRLRAAFFVMVTLVVYEGLFTPYSNWSESILMFPMMYVAAYLQGKANIRGYPVPLHPDDGSSSVLSTGR